MSLPPDFNVLTLTRGFQADPGGCGGVGSVVGGGRCPRVGVPLENGKGS